MEKIFIKRLVLVFGSCGEEDVAANEFMDNFAVAAQTAEGYRDVLVKFYGHLKTDTANLVNAASRHTRYDVLLMDISKKSCKKNYEFWFVHGS